MLESIVRHPDRFVPLEGVHNFRDLGGYPTSDGRTTTWRTFYRADGLYRLTPSDVERVISIGIDTVIDLRTADELAERGTFPRDRHPVEFHHLSVIDQTWDMDDAFTWDGDEASFLRHKYHLMIAEGGERVARALDVMSRPESGRVVFHCAAGKDRTGILAAILLAGVGVSFDVIAADFALSAEAGVRTREWVIANSPEWAARFDEIPPAFHAAHPESMRGFLDDLVDEHGSIHEFGRSLGLDAAVWQRLSARFTA